MEKKEQAFDIVRKEGIMEKGYGFVPKIVMQDKRLPVVSKAIYSYLASCAGSGDKVLLNKNLIWDELQISKDIFYEYLIPLIEADYIVVD